MKVYLDTNIIMEYFGHRDFYSDVSDILRAAEQQGLEAVISTNSLDTIIYLLGNHLKENGIHEPEKRQQIRKTIKRLLEYIDIVSISKDGVLTAMDDDSFKDIEDSLQYYCAFENEAECLVTINLKHFTKKERKIEILSPTNFVKKYIN